MDASARRYERVKEQFAAQLARLPKLAQRRILAAITTGEGAHPYMLLRPSGDRHLPEVPAEPAGAGAGAGSGAGAGVGAESDDDDL